MKTVILAGGLGTRLSEETVLKPKPMVEIGGKPIIWHIMKIYSHYGFNDFVICCGYKGYMIKEYFSNYFRHQSDFTCNFSSNEITYHKKKAEPWKITLVDTGENTMTGGRVKRIWEYVKDDDNFFLTYGDGVGNVNIEELYKFHLTHRKLATLTAVYPPGRFGALSFNNELIEKFEEKPKGDGALINGGFFVLSPKVIGLIKDDSTIWEQDPLKTLASKGNLAGYKHEGFWQPMDTLRDKIFLNKLWKQGNAKWKLWD